MKASSRFRSAILLWCIAMPGLVLAGAGMVAAQSQASPLQTLRNGNMAALIEEVQGLYEDHGISWATHISWDIQTYKTVYWYYNPRNEKIVVGDLPSPAQVSDYWQIWSQSLTDGNWDPDTFFKSQSDAYDMALFNQFVLTLHESAHAITYRYDPDHRLRHDYEINCREFYADRLTAAMLQHLGQYEPELEHMRTRYLDLVRAMHNTIPDQYLVAKADYADLVEDCAIIEVDQPTPDSLQAYASAYFTRWEALLTVELPPLEAVFKTHLENPLQRRIDWAEQAPEWAEAQVTTLRDTDHLADRLLNAGRVLDGGKRAAAFTPQGALWFAEARFDKETSILEYVYGPAEAGAVSRSQSMHWPRDSQHVTLRSIAAYGADSFIATFEESPYRTSLARFDQRAGEWMPRIVAQWDNTARAIAFRTADDRLFAGLTHFFDPQADKIDKSYWTIIEYDLQTGEVLGSHDVPVEAKYALGVDGSGRLYVVAQNQLFRIDALQNVTRIAGTGLRGRRDGPIERAELGWVQVLQHFPDGSVLFLEDIPGNSEAQMIRKLVPPPQP